MTATELWAGCDAALVGSTERPTRPAMYNIDTVYILNKAVEGLWCHPMGSKEAFDAAGGGTVELFRAG